MNNPQQIQINSTSTNPGGMQPQGVKTMGNPYSNQPIQQPVQQVQMYSPQQGYPQGGGQVMQMQPQMMIAQPQMSTIPITTTTVGQAQDAAGGIALLLVFVGVICMFIPAGGVCLFLYNNYFEKITQCIAFLLVLIGGIVGCINCKSGKGKAAAIISSIIIGIWIAAIFAVVIIIIIFVAAYTQQMKEMYR